MPVFLISQRWLQATIPFKYPTATATAKMGISYCPYQQLELLSAASSLFYFICCPPPGFFFHSSGHFISTFQHVDSPTHQQVCWTGTIAPLNDGVKLIQLGGDPSVGIIGWTRSTILAVDPCNHKGTYIIIMTFIFLKKSLI